MIDVLVVEDSAVTRELLVHILSSESGIEVIGVVGDGQEALEFLTQKTPDVITMDINMQRLDGIETTRRIMQTKPVPIVIVSAYWNSREVETTFRAMEAGAVAIMEKPAGIGHPDHRDTSERIIRQVRLMSEVRLVRRWARAGKKKSAVPVLKKIKSPTPRSDIKLVAMGGSTGAPVVIQSILSGLPKDFPLPVIIVQHIAAGFIRGMVKWLEQSTGFPTSVAAHGERPLPGMAYMAPDGFQMCIGSEGAIELRDDPPEHGLRPSVSYFFRSVTEACGRNVVGILLTGMGSDGAVELGMIKKSGGVTIAQNRESSVVYGMPKTAVELGSVDYILSPEEISKALVRLVQN